MTDNLKKWINGARTKILNAAIFLGVTLTLWTMIPGTASADPTEPPKASYGNINNAPENVQRTREELLGTFLTIGAAIGVIGVVVGFIMLAKGNPRGGKTAFWSIVTVVTCITPALVFGWLTAALTAYAK